MYLQVVCSLFNVVIFKFRNDIPFKNEVESEKILICEKHSLKDDIQKTLNKS